MIFKSKQTNIFKQFYNYKNINEIKKKTFINIKSDFDIHFK